MAILITGGAGYIGSHTSIELIEAGYDIVIVDNLSNSKICVLDRIEKICGKRPEFHKVDLLDYDALEAVFKAHPEIVAHNEYVFAVLADVSEKFAYYLAEPPCFKLRKKVAAVINRGEVFFTEDCHSASALLRHFFAQKSERAVSHSLSDVSRKIRGRLGRNIVPQSEHNVVYAFLGILV